MAEYRLCGGIFFSLITRAMKSRQNTFLVNGERKPGVTEFSCLTELVRVFYPEFETPKAHFKNDVLAYKRCAKSSGTYLPFDRQELVKRFDLEVICNYLVPLKRMRDFCNKYVDNLQADWLIRALLEVMDADPTITDETYFSTCFTGRKVDRDVMKYKDQFRYIKQTKQFYLPAFLLGVWHFIVTRRPDNTVGEATYCAWYRREEGTPGDIWTATIGEGSRFEDVESVRVEEKELVRNGISGRPQIRQDELESSRLTGNYSEYLSRIQENSRYVKTTLNSFTPWDFYSIYVPNRAQLSNGMIRRGKADYETDANQVLTLTDVDPWKLTRSTNFVILTGPGGIGKSMMMCHLLLSGVKDCPKSQVVPVMVRLKDYSEESGSLFKVIYSIVSALQPTLSEEDFADDLNNGHFLLLFDGMDEIRSGWRSRFEKKLSDFADTYSRNIFVISTRPQPDYVHMRRFTVARVLPFDKEQALQLIDRLDPLLNDHEVTANFRRALEERLYQLHTSFASNPLLLTIMLNTYKIYGDIPEKQYLFYSEAYEALARKQDAHKVGYSRVWETGWTPEIYADVFSEFCARTYMKERYDFSAADLNRIFDTLQSPKRLEKGADATAQQFIQDAVDSVCLMFYENSSYHFMHRSFQEYFCALYFSRRKDRNLANLAKAFEERNGPSDDAAFAMLYDMIPEKIEEFILLPYLRGIFTGDDGKNHYQQYLTAVYPVIRTGMDCPAQNCTRPVSFLAWFICGLLNVADAHENLKLPLMEEFLQDHYYSIWTSDGEVLYTQKELEAKSEMCRYEDYAGCTYSIPTARVLADREKYPELVAALEDEKFVLKWEFSAVYAYYLQLEEQYREKRAAGSDPFEIFE